MASLINYATSVVAGTLAPDSPRVGGTMLRQRTRVNMLPSSYPRRFTAISERWREIHSLQEPYSELFFEGTTVRLDALGSRGRGRDFRAIWDGRGAQTGYWS